MLSNMAHNENLIVYLVMLSETLVRLFVFLERRLAIHCFILFSPTALPPAFFIYCLYIHFDHSIFCVWIKP